MPEEKVDEKDIQQESAPANESESSPLSEDEKEIESFQSEHGGVEDQSDQSDDTQGNEDHQEEQEPKQPRAERRIQKLIAKMKSDGEPEEGSDPQNQGQVQNQHQTPDINAQPQVSQGLLTQEEIDNGVLDPEGFQRRLEAHVQDLVQKGVQQSLQSERKQSELKEIEHQFKQAVQQHNKDLESVSGQIDAELEDLAVAQYEAVNYQINPLTGKREFVPAVLMSEIVEKLKPLSQRLGESNRSFANRVSQTSAIPSSSAKQPRKSRPDTSDFSEFEKNFG